VSERWRWALAWWAGTLALGVAVLSAAEAALAGLGVHGLGNFWARLGAWVLIYVGLVYWTRG
jgi:hypothetical protein